MSRPRAEVFAYRGLEVEEEVLRAHYDLDGRAFVEEVTLTEAGDLRAPAPGALATLWYLIAGLSYLKAGAARHVDLGATPVGPAGRALVAAAIRDGLGEFAARHDLDLADVDVTGGAPLVPTTAAGDPDRVLVPFGGGIDSVVTVEELPEQLDQALFIVSPASGPFAALEATARVTGRPVVRASRRLDPALVADASLWRGHVPVTAMVTLLAATAAAASDRGGVVMSNERSASSPNLIRAGRPVNHQWSKSWAAEQLLGAAVAESVGDRLVVASLLRDRSELWVAERFSHLTRYHDVFRSCNRAFAQDPARRAGTWCGQCDKCLFVNLVLAPFVARDRLAAIFQSEPLADPARLDQLRTLVGLGVEPKPFECVGDPTESAAALRRALADPAWASVAHLAALAAELGPADGADLLEPAGETRVPSHWLR
ncbi:MAG: hypothetical protein ACP5OV_05430 [Acidimicrobiales bacterium]